MLESGPPGSMVCSTTNANRSRSNATHQYRGQNSIRTDAGSRTQQEQKSVRENTTYLIQQYRGQNSVGTDASYRTQQDRTLFVRTPLIPHMTTQQIELQENQRAHVLQHRTF
ncbi:Hypothetical predicted protein [Pelobates cultripes]|uniref:Uncharacterized protein n=1 Tax=Pelobates cultripes TaxID=61616 RepID=A0AAD1SR78_PELCU|nr:Hypothetical predicted protein [Pelobates cultripes]